MALILIVEDDAQVLTLTESYLQQKGHSTLSASTKEQALAAADVAADIDALFVDIGLKDDWEGGLALARLVRQRHPKIQVLYVTGQTITDGMKAMMVEGSGILEKPYTVDQLEHALTVHFGIKPALPQSK